MFIGFKVLVNVSQRVGPLTELDQKDGLAHAPETGEHHAFGMAARQVAAQCDIRVVELFRSADESGGRHAGAGAVRVCCPIHVTSIATCGMCSQGAYTCRKLLYIYCGTLRGRAGSVDQTGAPPQMHANARYRLGPSRPH